MKTHNNLSSILFVGVCVAVVSLAVARLIDLQAVASDQWGLEAEDNRWVAQQSLSQRGEIQDRFGQPLVWNERRYGLKESDDLWAEYSLISDQQAMQLAATGGGRLVPLTDRSYKFGPSVAAVTGYVGPITAQERQNRPSLPLASWTGKTGLESYYDHLLQPTIGITQYEQTARGEIINHLIEQASQPGQTLATNIDPYLSEVAYQALQPATGAVVVLDAQTGQVLSLVSSPSYDPALLAQLTDQSSSQQRQEQITAWFEDDRQPFFNRAVTGVYPPGSIFKMVTALAALSTDQVDATTTVVDEGFIEVNGYRYRNWYFTQYGRTDGEVDVIKALARSNDIYFYKAAEWAGPNTISSLARMIGLGESSGIDLPIDAQGLVPSPVWKEEQTGLPWYLGNTYHLGIGQGDLLVSPLQAAELGQVLGNNGVRCKPVVRANESLDCQELGLEYEDLNLVLQGMIAACSSGGTAFPLFAYNQQSSEQIFSSADAAMSQGAVACKTGTAEWGPRDEQGFRATHGWLLAIVEPAHLNAVPGASDREYLLTAEDMTDWQQLRADSDYPQRLVVAVIVESDETKKFREGSEDAGGVVAEIVRHLVSQAAEVD